MANTAKRRKDSKKHPLDDEESNPVFFCRSRLGLSRAHLAAALQCGLRSVYNWEEEGKPPKGAYALIFRWFAAQLKDPRTDGARWGERILAASRADDPYAWLIALALPSFTRKRRRRRPQATITHDLLVQVAKLQRSPRQDG